MIGIGNTRIRNRPDIENAVTNLTLPAKILLKFNFLVSSYDRYNISSELVKSLNIVTYDNIKSNIMKIFYNKHKDLKLDINDRKKYDKYIICIANQMMANTVDNQSSSQSITHNIDQPIAKNIKIKFSYLWTENKEYNNRFPDGMKKIFGYDDLRDIKDTLEHNKLIAHSNTFLTSNHVSSEQTTDTLHIGGCQMTSIDKYILNKKKYAYLMQYW
jgi:hypothetical protein